MAERYRYVGSQLFNFSPGSYFERTSRPIYAVVFLLPFIVFYELGTILINTDVLNQTQVRVVAFVWLQNFLEHVGFGSRLAWAMPAIAVIVILVALQLVSGKRWSFWFSDVWPMAIESVLLAVPLIVLSLFLNSSSRSQADISYIDFDLVPVRAQAAPCSAAAEQELAGGQDAIEKYAGGESQSLLASIVTGIGAGIYEELVFRLILVCLLLVVFQDVLKLGRTSSVILAVLVSAALFSAHHHVVFLDGRFGQAGPFNLTEFIFRTFAGIYFAGLFAIRGFGITAGAHAFYDILATLVNAFFFQG